MLRFGDAPALVALALPLFEEANRTRAFGVAILRALADRGVAGVLPDLPGQGESLIATADARLADLRAGFAAVPGRFAVAIRSGALLVDDRPCWLLSPQDGPALLRDVARIKGAALDGEHVEIAGNVLSSDLRDQLRSAHAPGDGRGGNRVVRFASDRRQADLHVEAAPLWRRAEPDNDIGLAQRLAADIADWVATCGA